MPGRVAVDNGWTDNNAKQWDSVAKSEVPHAIKLDPVTVPAKVPVAATTDDTDAVHIELTTEYYRDITSVGPYNPTVIDDFTDAYYNNNGGDKLVDYDTTAIRRAIDGATGIPVLGIA